MIIFFHLKNIILIFGRRVHKICYFLRKANTLGKIVVLRV